VAEHMPGKPEFKPQYCKQQQQQQYNSLNVLFRMIVSHTRNATKIISRLLRTAVAQVRKIGTASC
jgi:hypothetical protein